MRSVLVSSKVRFWLGGLAIVLGFLVSPPKALSQG